MSIDDKRRVAAAAFILLLTLSVFWPEPVVDANRICCNASLAVDDLSFLGREAPSWDVVYWFVAGLFLLALLQPGGDFRDVATHAKRVRMHFSRGVAAFLLVAAVVVAA